MATFSLGSGAVTPGAPGVYINERAGLAGAPAIATFSTTYMLVEVEESVPVTVFPFNTPIPVTSLAEYRILNAGLIPTGRIPNISYECVNEFFQNAQVGDLRVVRVGTPDQIVEIELLPSGQKQNNSSFPSSLQAGDIVYAQIILNGQQLVAGDGGTGYDPNGNWLGVPVLIPVDYIPGDLVNNRKISKAITDSVAAAIQTNPSISSAIYVRDAGLLVDVDPVLYALNENGYITLAATSFNGSVSVVTQTNSTTNQFVFTQGTYDVNNIVGASATINRVPQDYEQCINTAFDGQQDQGYLITPTAYVQFDSLGRAAVGAAAANLCANNSYKWLALADPGPYLVTDINQYTNYVPHQPAQNLITGLKYLIDNAIYEWTGVEVTYPRANYQSLVAGGSPEVAITESQNTAGSLEKVGLLDLGSYTANLAGAPTLGLLTLSGQNWPVSYQIQKVIVSGAAGGFVTAVLPNGGGTINLNGQEVYAVAPAFDTHLVELSSYPLNNIWLAQTATQASDILGEVLQNGGTDHQLTAPASAITFTTSGQATISYLEPQWDLKVSINGQSSDLIENLTDAAVSYNTLHLPGTLQSSTEDYRLGFTTRTIYNPATTLAAGTTAPYSGAAIFTVASHGLANGQKVFFTQHITANGEVKTLFSATTRLVQVPYYVTVVTTNTFVLSSSLTAYSAQSYVPFSGTLDSFPTIMYTPMYGGPTTAVSLAELETVPLIRGRKYGFASGNITNQAASAAAFVPSATNPAVSVLLNNSSQVVTLQQISAWGETVDAGYLPVLESVDPGTSTTAVDNFYCVPTVEQSFTSEAYLLPVINPIDGGAYDPAALSTTGPVATLGASAGGAGGSAGTYALRSTTGGTGTGATVNVTKVASTTGPIATLGAVVPGSGTIASATGFYTNSYNGVALNGGTGSAATGNITVTQTASVGPIAALGAPVAGSGTVDVAATTYTNTYPGVALVGGSGSAATANVTVTQTAGVGPLISGGTNSVGVITGGTGGTPGTYNAVALTNVTGTGTAATATITVGAGGDVTNVVIVAAGSGYANGNSLSALSANIGNVTGFSFLVAQVTLPVAVSAVALAAAGTGYTPGASLTIGAGSIGNVTGAGVALTSVNIPIAVSSVVLGAAGTGYTAADALTLTAGSIGGITGAGVAVATITAAVTVSTVTLGAAGVGYTAGDTLTVLAAAIGGGADLTVPVATIATTTAGAVSGVTPYVTAAGITNGTDGDMVQANIHQLTGVYFDITSAGTAPDGVTPVAIGDRIVSVFNGAASSWLVVPPVADGGDLSTGSQVLYGSQVSLDFTPQLTPPAVLWRFDAITSTEIINDALRGVGFNGVPQAVLVEAGIDNVTRLSQDSQRYFNPFGFIAYYGPYILNGAGEWLPPSPYVTGVALRRYRAEGYQFPPAGVKYQLADALGAQIPINSAQQNLLNPEGCNAIRTLPGYPQTAVFIWGGRTRINPNDAQQRLYQFVNTRVILNVVYGSLRTAFDNQIFNVIDGFGIVYNQIISVGNSVLNNLYVKGALFGAKPSEAFQVICDERINLPSNLEEGIVNAKVFVTPVPTLERIQIDLIRVAIGNMQNELNIQGLGQNNTL